MAWCIHDSWCFSLHLIWLFDASSWWWWDWQMLASLRHSCQLQHCLMPTTGVILPKQVNCSCSWLPQHKSVQNKILVNLIILSNVSIVYFEATFLSNNLNSWKIMVFHPFQHEMQKENWALSLNQSVSRVPSMRTQWVLRHSSTKGTMVSLIFITLLHLVHHH